MYGYLLLLPCLSWAAPEPSIGASLAAVLGGEGVVSSIFEQEFEELMSRDEIEPNSLASNITQCTEVQRSAGKSGSVFIKSPDGKFILKSISKVEFNTFQRIAPEYFPYRLTHPESTLVPIYGVFKYDRMGCCGSASCGSQYLILMANLVPLSSQVTRFFDLKGRTPKKHHHQVRNGIVDDNTCPDSFLLHVPNPEVVYTAVGNDIRFLQQVGLMDYSLFTIERDGTADQVHIIDFLTPYYWKKKVAHFCKRCKWRAEQLSTIRPERYAERFQRMVDRLFRI